MFRKFLVITLLVTLFSAALTLAETRPTESGFPFSVWAKHTEVTQIPWLLKISPPHLRSDLRREFRIRGLIKPSDLEKSGSKPDVELFARVLQHDKVVTPPRSVAPSEVKPLDETFPQQPTANIATPINLSMVAVAGPGKYNLEIALIDRATGRYNTRFEDVLIEGDERQPLERALQTSNKFEFVLQFEPHPDPDPLFDVPRVKSVSGGWTEIGPLMAPVLGFYSPRLFGTDLGFVKDLPRFVVNGSATTHLSVISTLSPPDRALADPRYSDLFRENLSHLLSIFTRLEVVRGSAQFTGVDLADRSRVFDRTDMKTLSADLLRNAILKDTDTVQLEDLAGKATNGRFFRELLRERFKEAENDSTGANHVIIVVGARRTFSKGFNHRPLAPAKACHCQVYYVRFPLVRGEQDDVDDLLKPYRPRVFEPRSWSAFRGDFGRIYAELLR